MPAVLPPRDRILHLLKTEGPLGAAALAKRLGVTATAVRQHLDRLLEERLVLFQDVSGRVGRPRRAWSPAPKAEGRFPDSHAELAVGVIEAAEAAFGEKGLRRLVARRTATQTERYRRRMPPPAAPLERRVAALARIRADEGYLATWSKQRDGSLALFENHCPIRAAARTCAGLCAAEKELFERVLGPGTRVVRTEHILSGARRCAYRIVAS